MIRDKITVFQTASVIDQRGKMVISMIAEPCAFRVLPQVQALLKVFLRLRQSCLGRDSNHRYLIDIINIFP
jgi:hypothetical protein